MQNYWLYQEVSAPPEFYALDVTATDEIMAAIDTMYVPPPPPQFNAAAFTAKYRQHLQAIILVGPDPEFIMAGLMTMFVPRIPPPHYNERLWHMTPLHHLLNVTIDTDEILAAIQTMPIGPAQITPEWPTYLELQENIIDPPLSLQTDWPFRNPFVARPWQRPWGVKEP